MKALPRKPPNLTDKLASALLTMVHEVDGKLVPVIDREEAKRLTAKEIVRRFEFDHAVQHALGGTIHPTNLTPRLRGPHRAKTTGRKEGAERTATTYGSDQHAIAKTKRLVREANGEPKRKRPKTNWPKGRRLRGGAPLRSQPFPKR